MRHARHLKKQLEYARFVHLFVVLVVVLLIFLFTTIPHKRWILLTVLVLSAGIHPGLILKRSWHRIAGTFLALLLLIPLLYLMQLNYRLISVCFVLALVASTVTGLNLKRYDIKVFFTTIVVFLLIAETIDIHSPQGPFEMVTNRGICTLIGAAILLVGDYVLFNAWRYSHKLYAYHQVMLYYFLKKSARAIRNARTSHANRFIFIERLRSEVISNYLPITMSAENLTLDLKTSEQVRQQVAEFQDIIWQIRRTLFAMTFSELMLYSETASEAHWQRFNALMHKARGLILR